MRNNRSFHQHCRGIYSCLHFFLRPVLSFTLQAVIYPRGVDWDVAVRLRWSVVYSPLCFTHFFLNLLCFSWEWADLFGNLRISQFIRSTKLKLGQKPIEQPYHKACFHEGNDVCSILSSQFISATQQNSTSQLTTVISLQQSPLSVNWNFYESRIYGKL